jgi:chemotaxis signal transduction protein
MGLSLREMKLLAPTEFETHSLQPPWKARFSQIFPWSYSRQQGGEVPTPGLYNTGSQIMTANQQLIGLFRPLQEIQSDEFSHNFLIVTLSDRTYGIETLRISELINLNRVCLVLGGTSVFKGVLSWYGDRIPVLDIRTWLGAPERPYDDRNYIVVIPMARHSIGLIVDQVGMITNLGGKQAVTQPGASASTQSLPLCVT